MSASSSALSRLLSNTFSSPLTTMKKKKPIVSANRKPLASVSAFMIGLEEIAELKNNKVLVASTLSYAIGQLSKSFVSAFNGDGIDLKAVLRSGGMPSVHSASVCAAVTSLALDRGFSDPIFGMSAVFAALVMYDAQGVRREVGYHAKIMNELLKGQDMKSKLGFVRSHSPRAARRGPCLKHRLEHCSTAPYCGKPPFYSLGFTTRWKLAVHGSDLQPFCQTKP